MIRELGALACLRLGGLASQRDRPIAASRWFLASLANAPFTPLVWLYLGNELMELGDPDAALGCYRRGLTLAPNDPRCRFNTACALLALGQFEEGWELYEARYAMPDFSKRNGIFGLDNTRMLPIGQLNGGRLLLFAEQGLGDSIMTLRYVPAFAYRFDNVTLRVPAPLYRLCVSSFADERNVTVISDAERIPEHDYFAPLMALPRRAPWLGRDGNAYLKPSHVARETAGLSVGLVWAAGDRPRGRSVPIEQLARLFDVPGVSSWVSLQVGPRSRDGDAFPLVGYRLTDFYETARVMAALDLVISVDSAPAHLAGALGVPVWTLLRFNPDWRWQRDRTDTLWYPSMRLFRQPSPGDWSAVIQNAKTALTTHIHREALTANG